jgi:hypothetical protein
MALRRVMALNNMSVTLLERSCPKQSRATSRDALHVVRRLSEFLDTVEDEDAKLQNEQLSWLADIEADMNERTRRAGERLSRTTKVVDPASHTSAADTAAGATRTPWEVEPILLDQHAHNPSLQRFYSMEEAALGNSIHPIKIDIFAESEDGASHPEDIVSAIILYNYALAIALDGDDQRRPGDPDAPDNATKLLLMSMELTYQRLDAAGDVSEQLGLHLLAMLSARAMIVLHRGNSESQDLYLRTHRSLLHRARALASMEVVLFGPKQDTAAAA